jgi:hypothetical protein
MPALFLLLAIIGAVVVGDLVLENPSAGEVTLFHHPIAGATQGQLLATAAALGIVVALLLAAAVRSAGARRSRRTQPRPAGRDAQGQAAGFAREDVGLLEELAEHDATIDQLDEQAHPADEEPDRVAEQPEDPHSAVVPEPAERPAEPLYEQSKRAARLRNDPDLWSPPTDNDTP